MFTRTAVGLASRRRRVRRRRRSTGPWKWLACWKGAIASVRKVILVCDNLNTHTIGAFYEAFRAGACPGAGPPPSLLPHAQARQLAEHCRERTEFADTAVRFADAASATWRPCSPKSPPGRTTSTTTQRGVDWQMKIGDARCKLKSVYPKIKL